ncbi:DNA replication protein psf2 [Glugoides intestinalis]
MTPEELINLALQSEVEIEPYYHIAEQKLLTMDFKACLPLKSCRIPLYLALHLRALNLCSIQTPSYLLKEFIETLVQKEKTETGFLDIPEFFFEHAIIFKNSETEHLLCELRCLRTGKAWKGLENLDGKALYVNGLTKWEFNELKDMIKGSMILAKKIECSSASDQY